MPVQALTEEEYAGHLNWQLWRDMLRFARPYRPYLAILMGIAAVTAGCEAGFNLATRKVIDAAVGGHRAGMLWGGGVYLGLLVTMACCVYGLIRMAG